MSTVTSAHARADILTCPVCGRRNRVPAAASGVPRCAACGAALPWLTSADDEDFDEVVLASSLPVLLDLWAPWCGPCRAVGPGVGRAADAFAGRLKVVAMNVDDAPRATARFQIQSLPTLLLLRQDRVQVRQVGPVPPQAALRWVRSALDHDGG
jgi:thioredoxin 2